MVVKLYGITTSPAVRAVVLCAKALEVELEWINVDLLAKDQFKPEYLKINPQHTVPLLDDDGFILADSHAIMVYLVSKYGKDDNLYPEELHQRAIVNHRLHFDSSILSVRGGIISRSLIFDDETYIMKKHLLALEEAFNITEKFLETNSYIAGNQLTIADFSMVTSVTTWAAFIPITQIRFPKLSAWLKKMEDLPYYYEGNQTGLDKFMKYIQDKIPQ